MMRVLLMGLVAASVVGCGASRPGIARVAAVTDFVRQSTDCAETTITVDELRDDHFAVADCRGEVGIYRCQFSGTRFVQSCAVEEQGAEAYRRATGDWAPIEAMSTEERAATVAAMQAASGASADVSSTAPAPTAAPPVTPPPAASTHPDDPAVRAAVDAMAPTILACAATRPVAVRASWGPDCQVTVTLHGAGAGTAEDACVRAAAARQLPTCTTGGSLLHVVGAAP